ncbi:MAG: hypothetical protein AB7L84_03550, partial [Acidimicrobiia bacterium]
GRSALLLKLVLLDLLGMDRAPLVDAQRAAFADLLRDRSHRGDPGDVVASWRRYSARAVNAFLDSLAPPWERRREP